MDRTHDNHPDAHGRPHPITSRECPRLVAERKIMTGLQKVAVIIAATGMVTTLVLPGRKTAEVTTAAFKGLTSWQKAVMAR